MLQAAPTADPMATQPAVPVQPDPQLIDPDKLYSVGQAAQILGVSIDTIRRWEQKGTLKAQRTAGMLRRFTGKELLDYQKEAQNQDLLVPISKAAQELHVSIQTLRRWDKSGKLKAERAADGARMYRLKQIRDISHGFAKFPGQEMQNGSNQENSNTKGQTDSVSNIGTYSANDAYINNRTSPVQQIPSQNPLVDNTASTSQDEQPNDQPMANLPTSDDQTTTSPPQPEETAAPTTVPTEEPKPVELPSPRSVEDHDTTEAPEEPTRELKEETSSPAEPEDTILPSSEPITRPPVTVEQPQQPIIPNRLIVKVSMTEPIKTGAEFDTEGKLTKPAIEDHGENAAGSAVLPAKCNKVVIKTKAVTKDSLVSVTPTTATDQALFVPMRLSGEGFAVAAYFPPQKNITFDWFIVEKQVA